MIAFRKLAEIMGQYLKKGSQAYIEGKLRTRKWQAQDGTDRYTTEIIADKLEMLSSSQGGNSNNWAQETQGKPKQQAKQKEWDGYADDEQFCIDLAKEVGVGAVPGSSFFREDVNHLIRLHFAKQDETLQQALDRLQGMKKLKK